MRRLFGANDDGRAVTQTLDESAIRVPSGFRYSDRPWDYRLEPALSIRPIDVRQEVGPGHRVTWSTEA
jgi:hypothetical protein